MTLRTVTYDDSSHKIVPIKSNGAWIDNLIKKNGEPSVEMTIQDMHNLVNELLDAAPEYQDTCTDGGKCGAGGYCKDCGQEPTKDE